ncbi:MAG TPA: SWIM zinc finger family protein [Kofleriaceae bacterium]|jgi:uncharacterized Zn finger protein|nr:SWIM zinc finger family protein [Kofleriaceae bacterium]
MANRPRGDDIASVLHRDTLAVLVGNRTYERGERCYAAGRVVEVAATRGELRGTIKPNESGRTPYHVRIWIRAEGMAYQCTCPIGSDRQFCKHGIALALAHLARPAPTPIVEPDPTELHSLAEQLVAKARRDPELLATLRELARGD